MITNVLRERPIFICGHPKSGTSLLRNLLDGHPQLAVYPEESHFFRKIMPKADGLSLDALIDLGEKELLHIFKWNQENQPDHQAGFPDRDYSFIQYEEVRRKFSELLRAEGIRHSGDVLWSAVQAFSAVIGNQQENLVGWVEKTPYNEYYADKIFDWWPQARCIHIVRDPRDNYASYQRKQRTWSPGKFSAHWNRSITAGFKNESIYGKGQYQILRYRDLVINSDEAMAEIHDFLDIEDSPILLKPTRAGEPWRGNSMFEDQFDSISAKAVGRWKEELPNPQIGIIQTATTKYRRKLDFRDENRVSIRDFIIGIYWRLRGQFFDLQQRIRRKNNR